MEDQRPSAQLTHVLLEVAPRADDHVPTPQVTHMEAAVLDDHVPTGQVKQALAELAPASALYVPTLHAMQR